MTGQQIFSYFQNKAIDHNSLFQVEIDVTSKCNANCPFCFQGDHNKVKPEMSLATVCSLLDGLRDLGTYYIGFSGGEPFARADFIDILREAKKRAFRVSLITNGMLLNHNMIDQLAVLNIDRITVSFHSIESSEYMRCFGISNKNLYLVALDNIKYMIEKDIPLGIAITVTKHNINSLRATTNFFVKLGIPQECINYNLLLTGEREIESLRHCNDDIEANQEFLSRKVHFEKDRTRLLCGAGIISCSIDAEGNVYPCTFFNTPAGSLYRQTIQEIWTSSHYLKIIRSLKEEMFTKCMSCAIKGKCEFCMASNLNETGNIFEAPESFCTSRKARVACYD